MSEILKKRNIAIHSPKLALERKNTKKNSLTLPRKILKEKDLVVIQIPEEMLIHQTMDIHLDNAHGKVMTLGSVETKILLTNGEMIFVPNFCLFNKEDL